MNSLELQVALTVLVVAVATVAVVRFEVFCLKDLARAEEWEVLHLTKPVWAALCLLWIPFGGILYLHHGRTR